MKIMQDGYENHRETSRVSAVEGRNRDSRSGDHVDSSGGRLWSDDQEGQEQHLLRSAISYMANPTVLDPYIFLPPQAAAGQQTSRPDVFEAKDSERSTASVAQPPSSVSDWHL